MRTVRREAFDEWSIGQLSLQFFELKCWSFSLPAILGCVLTHPDEQGAAFVRMRKGWTVALPTMSITWKRKDR